MPLNCVHQDSKANGWRVVGTAISTSPDIFTPQQMMLGRPTILVLGTIFSINSHYAVNECKYLTPGAQVMKEKVCDKKCWRRVIR